MSEALAVVQNAYGAFGRGDIPALLNLMSPDVVCQAFEPREFLVGPDHVTVIGFERTQALPNGRLFESEWVHVWQLREGRVCRFLGILDTEAAGLARP